MDQREQIGNFEEAMMTMLDGRQTSIWTSLPGIIQSFDRAKMTCVVQVALSATQTKKDGTQVQLNFPPLLDCPVIFPSGGGFALTFDLQQGDECLVMFASRCIDAWWQQGGVQPQAEFRMHDLSDGFVIAGAFSQPNVLPNIKENAAQLRSEDGMTYIEINDGGIVKVVAAGGINLNGLIIDSNGNLTTPGGVQAGTGTGDQVTLQTHRHPTAATGAPSAPTPGT